MSLSFLAPSRTALLVSDDALFIYSVSGRQTKMVEAVPWSAENFENNVAEIIANDCGGKSVVIINDMVEQHYRKERIPSVGVLDKSSIIKRKLEVAFPNYPVRAALTLKEKTKKTKDKISSSVCLFAAVPATDAFAKTMDAVVLSHAPIAGFCLLPIEAADMIKKISDRLVHKSEKKADWTIFVGQHQGGGLRQIVTRAGELALTRMTPIVETDDDPVLWANEAYQEFQATMSYLSRFGFDHNDGLNVIFVASDETAGIVSELIKEDCGFYSITPDELQSKLGLPSTHFGEGHHADGIHAGWIARKSRFILPMRADKIDTVSRPRQFASVASLLLFLGLMYLSYQLFGYASEMTAARSDMSHLTQVRNGLQLQLDKEIKRKKDLGFDIQLIEVSLGAYEQFNERHIDLFGVLGSVGNALGRDLRVDQISVVRGARPQSASFLKLLKDRPQFTAFMQMTFPSDTDAKKGNQEVQDLQARLQKMLPDHVVEVVKFLEDYEYSEALVVESRDVSAAGVSQDYIVEISIEGPPKK